MLKVTCSFACFVMTTMVLLGNLNAITMRPADFKKENHPNYNKKTGQVVRLDRKLEDDQDGSIDRLNQDIQSLHESVINCIDEEFDAEDMKAFNDILNKCVGEDYMIVLQTYQNIMYEVKEITKERIKNSMRDGFCDDILFMCIQFFKVIELFIKLDYDITKSLEFNRKEMERKINPAKLDYLIQISESKLNDYDQIRDNLIKEREFIAKYFIGKKEEYEQGRAKPQMTD